MVQTADEVDDIATRLAAGEAVPEVLVGVDDEGVGVVAAVDGTGSDEFMPDVPQSCVQAAVGEDVEDGDGLLEHARIEVGGGHAWTSAVPAEAGVELQWG